MIKPTPDPAEKHLKYEPAPPVPDWFARELKAILADQINGMTNQPFLRFSWAMDITEQIGEYMVHRYPDPDAVYVGAPNWVLEGWQDPSVYDEAQWRANEDVLGPFPAQGIWDYIETVPRMDGKIGPLGARALQMAREWRHWRSKTRKRALEDLLKQRCALQVLKERRWEDRKEEILDKFVRDFSNAEQGTYDPRRRKEIARIEDGKYVKTKSGLLVPNTA